MPIDFPVQSSYTFSKETESVDSRKHRERTMKHVCLGTEVHTDPTTRLIYSILEQAIAEQASYIHLEPLENEVQVRMRVEGGLRGALSVPQSLRLTLVSALKEMASMDASDCKSPQSGRATAKVGDTVVDLRIATLPCIYGEKVSIQLSEKDSALLDRAGIGLYGEDLEKFDLLMQSKNGLILIAGPAGSGKTSTLYTMLATLRGEQVNLVTLEDPVEYDMPGCSQVQVNESSGMSFVNGLRSILRQDPDIIALGELRDGQTARIAMQAALTGHLVLSAFHTRDALTTIFRLLDMGIEPYLISGALNGIVSQRLVRRICPHCKGSYQPTLDQLTSLGLPPNDLVRFYRGRGCPVCKGTGYLGRIAVFEILIPDDRLREAIREDADRESLEAALIRSPNFVTMAKSCRRLVLNGTTTLEEALRAISPADAPK